jgi:hypothetical protein
MDLAARQETDVRVHAQFSPNDLLHVSRPPESRRIDHPLNPARAGPDNVELKAANVAMFGLFERS